MWENYARNKLSLMLLSASCLCQLFPEKKLCHVVDKKTAVECLSSAWRVKFSCKVNIQSLVLLQSDIGTRASFSLAGSHS